MTRRLVAVNALLFIAALAGVRFDAAQALIAAVAVALVTR